MTYTVALNAEPASNMTVNIVSNNTDVTVGDSSLDFTTMNWETTQTVTIEAAEDDDAVIDMAVLTHSTTTNSRDGDSYGAATLDVNVTENDSRGVTISQTTDRAVGEGAQFTYTIVLDSEPTGPVSVNIGSSDTNAVMLAPKTHTFVQSGTFAWNVPQTIRVMGQDNIIDHPSDLISTITHTLSAASSDYASETAGSFVVTVTDNDTVEVVITRQSLTVAEGDNDVYFVSLRTRPSSGAVVVVLSDNHDEIMASPAMMTFDTNNYHIGQQVTVSNPQNSVGEDEESATITHMVSSGPAEYTGIPASDIPSVSVTLPDDNTRGITVSQSALTILEANTDAYTIVLLSAQADGNTVAITPASEPTADVTFTPPSLAFDDSDWNTAKTITVTAEDDRIDESTGETWDITHTVTGADYGANNVPAAEDSDSASNETATFAHTVSGGDYTATPALTVDSVVANTVDNDSNNISVSKSTVTFAEDESDTYTLRLTTDPEATATLSVSVTSGAGDNTVDVTTSTSTVTFAGGLSGTWGTEQTATVTSPADVDALGETATITYAVTSGNYTTTAPIGSVSVTITDPDEQGVTVSATSFSIDEGASDSYTIVFATEPVGGNVTVTVNNPNTADLTATASVTFNTTNWNAPMSVNLSPVDDDIDDDGETVTVTHSVAGADLDYESASGPYTVSLTATDSEGNRASVEVMISVLDLSMPGVADLFDINHDERISRDEALSAIDDYFRGAITKEDMLGIMDLYESA